MIALSPALIYLLTAAHGETPKGLWDMMVQSNFLNFLIALGLLIAILIKFNVVSMLDARQVAIGRSLAEAQAKKEQAEKDLKAIEQRMAQLDGEVSTILKEAEQTAEQLKTSIITQAENDAAKLLANMQKRIAQEQSTAARDLEQRLMREAIYSARQLLENTLSDEDKQRSVKDFVAALPQLVQQEVRR